jgi:Domain of unknown function (DUF4189)/Prokaryotic phospholipase A2
MTMFACTAMALGTGAAVLCGAVPALAASGDYAAIAYSPSTGVAAGGYSGSQVNAEGASVTACKSTGGGQDCAAYVWVEDGFASMARSGDSFGTGWGTTADNARRYAIQICQQHGGANCVEVFSARTSDTVDNSPSARGGSASSTTLTPAPSPRPAPAPNPQAARPNGCSDSYNHDGFFNFTSACNRHDLCYMDNGGPSAPLAAKFSCDNAFHDSLKSSCGSSQTGDDHQACLRLADLYYFGVAGAPIAFESFFAAERADRKGPLSCGTMPDRLSRALVPLLSRGKITSAIRVVQGLSPCLSQIIAPPVS